MKIAVNSQIQKVSDPTTVLSLLQKSGIHPDRVAVEVNLEIIERAHFETTLLKEGDKVEVIGFVGGG